MPIWELTPIDSNHPNWRASMHTKPAVIRAPSEERAREIAAQAFREAAEREPGEIGPIPTPPWGDEGLVRCRRLEESVYSEDGPEAILKPAEYGQE